LRPQIREELETLLSLDSDDELFHYQCKNEKKIGKFLGGKYSIGCSSGTTSLQFSLTALGIGPGDEVIVPANSYIASALAVTGTGATPRFADVSPDTMLLTSEEIKKQITKNTKAVLPVHLYGQMCNMKKISKLAKNHGLKVVEDAAHAHLAQFDNEYPGRFSDAACYSFFPSKTLGGMFCTCLEETSKLSYLS